jgi:hypothetical protein
MSEMIVDLLQLILLSRAFDLFDPSVVPSDSDTPILKKTLTVRIVKRITHVNFTYLVAKVRRLRHLAEQSNFHHAS